MCAYVNKEKENRDYLTIDNDIRDGRIKNVYLLHGVESYLIYQYRDKLLRALDVKNPDNAMNYTEFVTGARVGEIIDTADTMPFFSDYRVILVSDCGFFKQSSKELAEYIKKDLPDATHILFVESEKADRDTVAKSDAKEVDKRNALYKAVKERGAAIEFMRQSDQTLKSWIGGRLLKAEDKTMSSADLDYYLARIGNDMSNIKTETEKLISYTMGRSVITRADIDEVVTITLKDKVFDMIADITSGNHEGALQKYYELIGLKVPVPKILYNLSHQFSQMLAVKQLREKGLNSQLIAERLKMGPRDGWKVERSLKQAAGFSVKELESIVTDCVETEEKIKTGRLSERLGLEMLIVKYSVRK